MSKDTLFAETVSPYARPVQARLKELRTLIFETARKTEGVGKVEEALRWGQLSFLTPETGSGSTIRIDGRRNNPGKLALYVHCQSGLAAEFKTHYPKSFVYEGDRALVFDASAPLPRAELSHCIALALTHHLRKKEKKTGAKRGATSNHHRHGSRPG